MADFTGTTGDDIIVGTNGADNITGGLGNDTLTGDDGNDNYFYSRGDGNDTIIENSFQETDTLNFSDINSTEVSVTRDESALIINIPESSPGAGDGGSVRLNNNSNVGFSSGVEFVIFADAVTWTSDDIRQIYLDSLSTAGNDILDGFSGNENYTGGLGDDTLDGGSGNDSYFYTRGDGNDTILEGANEEFDTLTFTGVDSTDVTITRDINDMILNIAESSPGAGDAGSVVLTLNAIPGFFRGVQEVFFSDGVMWTEDQIRNIWLAEQFTAGDDVVSGFNSNDIFNGGLGNDTLSGGSGDDSYFYTRGDGDDIIVEGSNEEVDTLTFTGVDSTDVTITRDGNDMTLVIAETSMGAGDGGSVQLNLNALTGFNRGVDNVIFADGITWTSDDIRANWLPTQFTDGDDVVTGFNSADTLEGGLGNDTLSGGGGNDNYIYSRGDGDDIIIEGSNQEIDTLTFTDIASTEITTTRDGNNLTLVIAESAPGAGDAGSVQLNLNSLPGFNRGVDNIVFSDAVSYTSDELRQLHLDSQITPSDDITTGFDSSETIMGSTGNDQLMGGRGNDTYLYARGDGDDVITESSAGGEDRLQLEDITSTEFDVTVAGMSITLGFAESAPGAGDAGSVNLSRALGAFAQDGTEQLLTSDGVFFTAQQLANFRNDGLGTAADDTITGTAGTDVISSGDGEDYLVGGAGTDFLRGDAGDDILYGGFGADYLRGGAGADDLQGWSGADWADYITSAAAVTVNLETGIATGGDAEGDTFSLIERIFGSNFDDTLTGDAGNNYIRGWNGDDALNGGSGNDYLQGGAGADVLDGGDGEDWAYYFSDSVGATINLADSSLNAGDTGVGDSYISIENVFGSSHNDTLTGDANNNVLRGYLGDDTLNGGDGDDFLRGDQGADVLSGGAGNDWAYYAASSASVTVNLATGAASGGHAAGDTFTSIERVFGSNLADDITGDSGANYLRGSGGNDIINGGDGADFLQGDSGSDTLDGGAGTDWAYYVSARTGVTVDLGNSSNNTGEAAGDIYISIESVQGSAFDDNITGDSGVNFLAGREGDDMLNGGAGADTLRGDAGADTFVFEVGTQSDLVVDYDDLEDMLDFSDFGFADVTAALATAADVGGDVVFTIGGDVITIENTTIADITDNIII